MLCAFLGLPFLVPGEAFVFRYLGLFALGLLTFQKFVGLLSMRAFLLHLPAAAVVAALSLGTMEALAGLLAALAIAFLKIPTSAPLTWLGAVSYSLYLLHVPIGGRAVNLGSRWAHDTASQIAVLAVAVAISLAASYLLYRFVERPARRWSSSLRYERKALSPRSRPAATPDLSNSQQ
jgi:peptidoglycan/LPS O-acetylase OafA/YrhL